MKASLPRAPWVAPLPYLIKTAELHRDSVGFKRFSLITARYWLTAPPTRILMGLSTFNLTLSALCPESFVFDVMVSQHSASSLCGIAGSRENKLKCLLSLLPAVFRSERSRRYLATLRCMAPFSTNKLFIIVKYNIDSEL